jgi:hypothetical protein
MSRKGHYNGGGTLVGPQNASWFSSSSGKPVKPRVKRRGLAAAQFAKFETGHRPKRLGERTGDCEKATAQETEVTRKFQTETLSTRRIAAWLCQAGDKASTDRVYDTHEYNWDGAGRFRKRPSSSYSHFVTTGNVRR